MSPASYAPQQKGHRMSVPAPTADVPHRPFSPIARGYDRPAQLLSLFQYRRWHRFLLSRLQLPLPMPIGDRTASPSARAEALEVRAEPAAFRVLDMASGTGALAFDLM